MKKIVLVCGLIAGLIVSAMLLITIAICYSTGNFEGSMVLGYTMMLLAFSLIFIGVKNYRDKYNNGVIGFGKAFKIGLYISLIASTIYVAVWMIDYYLFVPDFMDKYAEHMINQTTTGGASQLEINEQVKKMTTLKEWYKNPLMIVLLTYAEILPVGLIVSLISALLLKQKKPKHVQAA